MSFLQIFDSSSYINPQYDFDTKKINNIKGLNFIFGEVMDWESLSLLQAVYKAPIAIDPGTETPLCASDGLLSHCLWSPVTQAGLIVSHQGEAAALERLESKALLLQIGLGPSVSEPWANFWTHSYEFILHMAAIASTTPTRVSAFKAACAALSCLQNFTAQLRHKHPAVYTSL